MRVEDVAATAAALPSANTVGATVFEQLVPPLIGLVGVAVGGILQWLLATSTAKRQRREMLADKDRLEDRDRALAALAFSECLEDFVLHCIEVVQSAEQSQWDTPYDPAAEGAEPVGLKAIGDWSELVDWRLLGFKMAVRASNFRREVGWSLQVVSDASDYLDGESTHGVSAELAARRGLEAWELAVCARRENGLEAFSWSADADGIELLQTHLDKRDAALKSAAAALANYGLTDDLPSDNGL